jgi:hypothetical protein
MKFLSAYKSGELTGVVHALITRMECISGVTRVDQYILNISFLPDACCVFKNLSPTLPDACDKNNID